MFEQDKKITPLLTSLNINIDELDYDDVKKNINNIVEKNNMPSHSFGWDSNKDTLSAISYATLDKNCNNTISY